jgi:hypothetical protein
MVIGVMPFPGMVTLRAEIPLIAIKNRTFSRQDTLAQKSGKSDVLEIIVRAGFGLKNRHWISSRLCQFEPKEKNQDRRKFKSTPLCNCFFFSVLNKPIEIWGIRLMNKSLCPMVVRDLIERWFLLWAVLFRKLQKKPHISGCLFPRKKTLCIDFSKNWFVYILGKNFKLIWSPWFHHCVEFRHRHDEIFKMFVLQTNYRPRGFTIDN